VSTSTPRLRSRLSLPSATLLGLGLLFTGLARPVAAQQHYIKPLVVKAGGAFGRVIAVSGETAAVAGYDHLDRPAVLVFVRSDGTWAQQAILQPLLHDVTDAFSQSVDISGDTIVVGASWEDSAATGVNGDTTDDSANNSGAAYVFVRNGTSWSQQAYLKASNTAPLDYFGESVSVSGDTIVVGAALEDSSSGGVDGDQSSNGGSSAGAAYVFVRNGTSWSQQAYLKPLGPGANDEFGCAVDVHGDTIIVGAWSEDGPSSGINGDQFVNGLSGSGAAFIFVRNGTTWTQEAYLKASNSGSGDNFGRSVTISGDTAVVGATREDSGASGVDGDQTSNSVTDSGAAYVFVRNGGGWFQQAYLKASNPGPDSFADVLSLDGDSLVVGAMWEKSNATGVNGDGSDNSLSQAGAAYVYHRAGNVWNAPVYLKASNTKLGDNFGQGVGVIGSTVLVGSPGEDSESTGVNGDPFNNGESGSGAVFVYDLEFETSPWTDLGFALAGVHGQPLLAGDGPLTAGSAGSLTLSNAAGPGALAVLFVALASTPAPFKGGTLVPVPPLLQISLATAGNPGSIVVPWASWPSGLSGVELYFQFGIADVAAPAGLALSNAVRADLP